MNLDIKLHKEDLPDQLALSDKISVDCEFMGLNVERDQLCLVQLSTGNNDAHIIKLNRENYKAPNLKKLLEASSQYINKGGRLVCISYHSLEDRIVKRYIQNGSFDQQVESDIYGNKNTYFRKIGKIVTPSEYELNKNKRSRSAKLRIAEKI